VYLQYKVILRLPSKLSCVFSYKDMSKLFYYAVVRGRSPGVYNSWAECSKQVTGFSGAIYKKYASKEEATFAVSSGTIESVYKSSDISEDESRPIFENSIVVFIDGSSHDNGAPNSRAGCSAVFPHYPQYNSMKKLECGTTNDRAEKEALLLAWDAFSSFSTEEKLNKRLHVYSDSNTLVKTVNEWMNGKPMGGLERQVLLVISI
jgi:ribonuclease HI